MNRAVGRASVVATLVTWIVSAGTVPAQDEKEAFQKSAIEYALGQQKKSAFVLTRHEQMRFNDLRKILQQPWQAKIDALRARIEGVPNSEQVWKAGLEEIDGWLLGKFRANLRIGRHSEAFIYYSLLWHDLESEDIAAAEAYRAYQEAYQVVKAEMKAAADAIAGTEYDCRPYGNQAPHRVKVTILEGPGPQDPDNLTKLSAGPTENPVWPYFPTLYLLFGLSDNSESGWNNFILADIRHYDRTTGDNLRIGLDWMTGNWGVYHKILADKGVQDAQDTFRKNLRVTSNRFWIEFEDTAAHVGFAIYKTRHGALCLQKRRGLLNRCTKVEQRERRTKGLDFRPKLEEPPTEVKDGESP